MFMYGVGIGYWTCFTKYFLPDSFYFFFPSQQETPLHFACKHSDPKIAEYLIEKGASVNARTDKVFSRLFVIPDRYDWGYNFTCIISNMVL
jgi:ankyrin repeat protein